MLGAELVERVDDLGQVWAGRLHHADIGEELGDAEAGGPGAQSEGVDYEQRFVAQSMAIGELEHLFGGPALLGASQPAGGGAAASRGLVDHHAGGRDPPADAALGLRVALYIGSFVGLGDHVEVGQVVDQPQLRLAAPLVDELFVGGNVGVGALEVGPRPPLAHLHPGAAQRAGEQNLVQVVVGDERVLKKVGGLDQRSIDVHSRISSMGRRSERTGVLPE